MAEDALKKLSNRLGNTAEKVLQSFFPKWVLFPGLLLLFGLGLSFYSVLKRGDNPGILNYYHSKEVFNNFTTEPLYKGEYVEAEINAKADNLGIVAVRFNTYSRNNTDELLFRIKEKNSNNWYYENTYDTGTFLDGEYFTFGFPRIKESNGKQYIFELYSLQGEEGDSVSLVDRKLQVETRYQYTKRELTRDKKNLIDFITKKFLLVIRDPGFWIAAFYYFIPLFIYFAFLKYGKDFFSSLTTIEDWFSLLLIVYLINEILIQSVRLAREYLDFEYITTQYLETVSKPLLILTLVIGIIVALSTEPEKGND
jgi:hypothetical protein